MVGKTFGGTWTQEKLEILRRYLNEYTTVLKKFRFTLIYVDAFAGGGLWQPGSGYELDDYGDLKEFHKGSPRIALEVQDKPFDRFLFVDYDPELSQSLLGLRREFPTRRIDVVNDDANTVLPHFCKNLRSFDRAVVFLDPYATQVSWDTVEAIAETKKVDCWILFPRSAIARMMPNNSEPPTGVAKRLDWIIGSRQYWQSLYSPSPQLQMFTTEQSQERKPGSEGIALCYMQRLESAFEGVAPTRRTFRNSKGSPMFELFFAASNPVGAPLAITIADHILKNW